MFRKFVIRVMRSYEGQRLIEQAVRVVLEDKTSSTRQGMMRIIRAEARDAVQDTRERERELAELDAGYQEWAQQRREALLLEEKRKQAQTEAEARRVQELAQAAVLENPLARFPLDQPVRVVQDALFEGRLGRVTGVQESSGFPEVYVQLEGHDMAVPFAPAALEPFTAVDLLDLTLPVPTPQDEAPTTALPAVEQ